MAESHPVFFFCEKLCLKTNGYLREAPLKKRTQPEHCPGADERSTPNKQRSTRRVMAIILSPALKRKPCVEFNQKE